MAVATGTPRTARRPWAPKHPQPEATTAVRHPVANGGLSLWKKEKGERSSPPAQCIAGTRDQVAGCWRWAEALAVAGAVVQAALLELAQPGGRGARFPALMFASLAWARLNFLHSYRKGSTALEAHKPSARSFALVTSVARYV